ncbi:MAG: DUF2244 domain-containing protein [Paracoccus sp. (in: a-proteobacteria)]|uniref:DUF2244 domain-containing protein n=1 Tax=Paracoccus sp. TaxID=267 RepID=UPI0026DFF06D|nr:DUF2244 domain-containing protein [Paracoccus sp. (in: a-proteobacteria)]MDO5632191.1 DUF2244 domain-containing protein [Paracoccus sp. (in: a-proteobacteria)]
MPYEWQDSPGGAQLTAWPYRSLSVRGFVWVIGVTAVALCLPLIAVVGTSILWGLLPFTGLALWGLWFAIGRSYRTGRTQEVLTLTRDQVSLTRRDPGRADRHWQANSYWVRPVLRAGPVEDYLILTDGQRELELGAFLTPDERRALHGDLLRRLAALR